MFSREDKNPFIQEFYGEPDDIFTDKNLIVNHSFDCGGVKSQLKKYRNEKQTSIDNIFLFYTNNDRCKSYVQVDLNRWNTAYNVGVKNCFVFYFTDYPFRLNYIWRKGKQLCSNFLAITDKDFSTYSHFIVFDESEINYLFNVKKPYEHKFFPDDQLMFKDVLGSLLDTAEYRIQERNKFALCLNSELSAHFKQYLSKTYDDYDEDGFQFSFEWQKEKAEGEILPFIKSVIVEHVKNKRIAIVVDKNTDGNIRKALVSLFQSYHPDLTIQFYDYSSLNNGNDLKEECVIVLQYRPHYVKQLYAKYPNSFDPYTVRSGQYVCDIIQGFIFADMYLWDKYEYDKVKYDIMYSEVRKELFGGIAKPEKPNVSRTMGETDFSDEQSSRALSYVKGAYENGKSFSILDSDYVICEVKGEMRIARLNDLKRSELLLSISKMQKLDEIAVELRSIIEHNTTNFDEREKVVRQSFFNLDRITESERDSDIVLWKILLKKKIDEEGLSQAYNTIMNGLKESERIRINQFKRWVDFNDKMILPLQKVCQQKLFEYLGFGKNSPYLWIMRSKKLSAKKDTRTFNAMITNFLLRTLLFEADVDLFEEIRCSDINDLLQLEKIEDLQSLVDLLKEKICLTKIAKIQ